MNTTGCGRFFEGKLLRFYVSLWAVHLPGVILLKMLGNAEEMHKALNETLASLPDETKVYVSRKCPPLAAFTWSMI
jgi:hypothetical protein